MRINEKLKDIRLRWYDHVQRREKDHNLRKAEDLPVTGKRKRGNPKKIWKDSVKKDTESRRLQEEDVKDRTSGDDSYTSGRPRDGTWR